MGILDFFRRSPTPSHEPEATVGTEVATTPEAVTTLRPRAYGEHAEFDGLKDPKLAMFLRGGAESSSGSVVTADTAMRVGAVYGCVRIISGAVATMPLDVKRRVNATTRLDADDHSLWKVLRRRPNSWMKPAQFRRMMQAHLLLRGNAYAMIARNSMGEVTDLLPLHPDRVKVSQNDDLSLRYEYHRLKGGKLELPQEDVFHLMGMTLDGITGVSVITYARETVGLAQATAQHGASFFRNGTHVGTVLKHPNQLGLEGQDLLRQSLEKYRGASNAHKTLILEEGMDFASLGMSAADAQFVETLKLTRTDIGMFFGVPPHMLGDTEKSTSWGTGIEQQSAGFVAYTLEDWLTCWEEGINADLIGERDPKLYARFNRAALVRGDFKARWEGYVKGLQWGVYSPDDIRALEDENPRPDGKGGVYYDPPNTAGGKSNGDQDDDPQDA
jgi:HK97 family phage portal protein